jgi:acetyl-CoA synthetase
MALSISNDQLTQLGLTEQAAQELIKHIKACLSSDLNSEHAWPRIAPFLLARHYSFDIHLYIFSCLFPDWPKHLESAPTWIPDKEAAAKTHIGRLMTALNMKDVASLHDYSVNHYADFWQTQIKNLGIVFKKNPQQLCDLSQGLESPIWLAGAKLNIVDSCFTAPADAIALFYQDDKKNLCQLSYGELHALTNRIANSLMTHGFTTGDARIATPLLFFLASSKWVA